MLVYQPLETKDLDTGKWYKIWEIPDGCPIPMGTLTEGPDEKLSFPKYDSNAGFWVEDKDSIISSLMEELESLKNKQLEQETALLNYIDLSTLDEG